MRKTIKATDGHILTNGNIYGSVIHLADGMDASEFHEITVQEYNAISVSGEATEEDYQAALGEFGVET